MNHFKRRRGRLLWRIGAGVIVVVSASIASLSGQAASPVTARLTATSTGDSPAAGAADQVTPATGGPCPPNPTYPSSPTDQTQYGVPFTADILAAPSTSATTRTQGGRAPSPSPTCPGSHGRSMSPVFWALSADACRSPAYR